MCDERAGEMAVMNFNLAILQYVLLQTPINHSHAHVMEMCKNSIYIYIIVRIHLNIHIKL